MKFEARHKINNLYIGCCSQIEWLYMVKSGFSNHALRTGMKVQMYIYEY